MSLNSSPVQTPIPTQQQQDTGLPVVLTPGTPDVANPSEPEKSEPALANRSSTNSSVLVSNELNHPSTPIVEHSAPEKSDRSTFASYEAAPPTADETIGDASDCQIVAGSDNQGVRTVAVIDRAWLRQWSDRVRSLGAHRLSAKPIQLCLPLSEGRVSASLLRFASNNSESHELVVRFGLGEGTGVPLGEKKDDDASALQILHSLSTLANSKPVDLALPREELERYQRSLSDDTALTSEIELRVGSWSDWIASIDDCEMDLMIGAMRDQKTVFDSRRWRAAAVFATTIIVLNISALNWDWWRLHRESQRLQLDMQRVYSTAVHDATGTAAIEPANALAGMKKRRMALRRAAGESSTDDFLVLSAALGDAWPVLQQAANIDARAIASMDYRNAGLELHLKPGLQLALVTVRKVLSERGLELSVGSDATLWKIRSIR